MTTNRIRYLAVGLVALGAACAFGLGVLLIAKGLGQ